MKDKTPIARVPSSLDRRLPKQKDAAGRLAYANREIRRMEFLLEGLVRIREGALRELEATATEASD
jgi:hypothetical protein